ncbi:hypothetical protein [Pedobacter yulinensis]|nr:hypothetical protein [Pedobacter yulinensis]
MIKWYAIGLLLLSVLTSCVNRRFYQQADYPFYSKAPAHGMGSLPRSDGVYMLQAEAGVDKGAAENRLYKFYDGGQVNMILGIDHAAHPDSIISRFNNEALRRRTLFQGYYRVQGKQLVIQQVNTARRQFTYDYFFVEKDCLIHVSSGIEGRGRFRESPFASNFRAVYSFLPLRSSFTKPIW